MSYPSAEMQPVYSIAETDWTSLQISYLNKHCILYTILWLFYLFINVKEFGSSIYTGENPLAHIALSK